MQALIDAASALPRLQSLVVLDTGKPVVAEAFSITGIYTPVNIKSVSKSVLSALTGIAIERGVFDSVSQTLSELAPELIPQNADSRVGRLSVENLLTMQTGLQRTAGRNYGAWAASEDWVAYVLSAVLSALTGQSLLSLVREWLGKPLQIEFPPWTRDRQGRYLGGDVMTDSWIRRCLTPRTRSPWSGDEYGYGWFIRNNGTRTYYYGRGYGGQFVFVLPS